MEILNKYNKLASQCYSNLNLTIEEFQNNFKSCEAAEEEINIFLKTKTVKVLKNVLNQMGCFHDSRHKKADLIEKIYDSVTDWFLIGRPVSYMCFSEENHESAKDKLIRGTTADVLKAFQDERRAKQEETETALNNPETLSDFRKFIDNKGIEALTPEQLEKYEQLKADLVLKNQAADEERERKRKEEERKKFKSSYSSNNVDLSGLDLSIHKTKHSKTGADLFTVIMGDRVSKQDYYKLRDLAKSLGGYYSRYKDLSAEPPILAGFIFKTEAAAVEFLGEKPTEEAAEVPAELTPNQKTANKLREIGKNAINKGEEVLSTSRTTNTARQLSQAQNTEADARSSVNFGKKMLSIADQLELGNIKYLHKLKNGAQLRQLESILSLGFNARTKEMTYTERENAKASKSLESMRIDVNFVVYPFPLYSIEVLKNIFLKYSDTAGMKQAVRKILDYGNRYKNKNGVVIFDTPYMLDLLKKTALKLSDKWDVLRIVDNIKDYERLVNMGITDLFILKTALRELLDLSAGTEESAEDKQQRKLQDLERNFIGKKIDGFFPTPEKVINKLFSMIKINDNDAILEPSAGLGHIADKIKEEFPNNKLNVIEYNSGLCEVLEAKGFEAENEDFLKTSEKYDVIIMNPPFEKNQDIDHVLHAYNLLNDGGRLVSVMAGNKIGRSQRKLQEFEEFVNNNGHFMENESGSFKDSFRSTGVNTVNVYLEK